MNNSSNDNGSAPMHIAGYQILKQVGRGGIATVYLAIQKSLQRQVALKVMAPALTTDPTFTDRFIQEGRTIAQLNHPGIVTIYDISVVEYHHYIAMEYLQGDSLKQRLKRRPPVDEVLDILYQLASALDFAHGKGIVHRDVKPENVMFRDQESNEAVLTDFGIAKSDARQTQFTNDGMVVGTPRYMSPEQAEGRGATPRSDIYALGIIFYELLTGTPPFGAKDSLAVLYSHINDPVPKLPRSHRHLQPLLEDMLAKKPEHRVPDCATLLERLEEFQDGSTIVSMPPAAATPGRAGKPSESVSRYAKARTNLGQAGRYVTWGGLALLSLVILSTVLWGISRPIGEDMVDATLPEGEVPVIVAPARIDLTLSAEDGDIEAEPGRREPVEINALLALADRQIERDYLTTPAGNNALDTYRAILRIDPDNAEATQGLRRIADRYELFAKRHFERENYTRVLSSARAGLAVWPEHEALKELSAKANAEGAKLKAATSDGSTTGVAVSKYFAAAASGNTKSQFDLALAYGNGDGVEPSQNESIRWLRRAADGDHVGAQYNLALGLLFGPEPSAHEAGEWIKLLANNHYEPAYRVLGWMYTTGTGVERSSKEAVRWSAKSWGGQRLPSEVIVSWQESFEHEYYEAIGRIREEKLTTSESLK